ncbi:MAG TPA: helix-turn-helix domain-containing protein, partial [bacterium]|nr:helix-turn-helix domain-containing protein [bacterium]
MPESSSPTAAPRPHVLRRPEEAAAVLAPLRLRILRNLEFPASATSLARRLRLPRQKVNYHLRELERRGLVHLVRERKAGNCTERLLQAVSKRFVLSPEVLGGLAAEPATLPEATEHLRATFETPEAARAFLRELRAEAERLAERHGAPRDARPDQHVVVLALHPARAQVRLP